MAKIAANTMLLYLKELGAEDWQGVVCLTSHGFDGTTGTNDDATFCGPDSSPGTTSATVAIAGKTFLLPETNQTSAPQLLDWWQAKTQLDWKVSVAEPVSGESWIKEGEGFLSSFGDNYDVDQTGAFTATLTVSGLVDSYIYGESPE